MKKRLAGVAVVAAAIVGAVLLPDSPREGCGAKCCRRPAGAPVESCLRRDPSKEIHFPDGGVQYGPAVDFGDLNTMPGTHAVGSGCAATECVSGQGIEWLDGGSK